MVHAIIMQEDGVDVVAEGADNNLSETGAGGPGPCDDQLALLEGNFSAVAEELGTQEDVCKTELQLEPLSSMEEGVLQSSWYVKK